MAGFVDTNEDALYEQFYGRDRFVFDALDLKGQKEREERRRAQLFQSDTIVDSGPSGPVQEPTPAVRRRLAASDEMLRAVRAAGGDFSRFSST